MLEDGVPVLLWDGPAPGSESWAQEEVAGASAALGMEVARNITVPTLTPYLPERTASRAVIVCPGGAFHFLAVDAEGRAVAEILRDAGIAALVLRYRVVPTPAADGEFVRTVSDAFRQGADAVAAPVIPLATADALRAVEVTRAAGYQQVTLLGFSAGARVTAEAVLRGPEGKLPDAAAAIYLPSLRDCSPGEGSPPLFVLAAADDPLGVDGSFTLATSWLAAKVPVELHLFERGGHGFGARPQGIPASKWPELFLAWLNSVPMPAGDESAARQV